MSRTKLASIPTRAGSHVPECSRAHVASPLVGVEQSPVAYLVPDRGERHELPGFNRRTAIPNAQLDSRGRMRRATVALALGLIACNDAAAPGSELGRPPVVSVAPSPGATSVDRKASIVIGFDRALDESVFQATALNVWGRWSGPIAGSTVLEVGNTQLRFTPQVPFAAGERITVSIPRLPGNGNEGGSTAHPWTFRARAAAGLLDLTHTGVRTVRMSGEGLIQSYGAYAGDFNRDGYPDLMVPNERSNDVRVFLNDGSGDYGDFVRLLISGGDTPSTNEGADFNGDGLIDFAVGNAGNDLVSVYRGVGAGAFDHAGSFRRIRACGVFASWTSTAMATRTS